MNDLCCVGICKNWAPTHIVGLISGSPLTIGAWRPASSNIKMMTMVVVSSDITSMPCRYLLWIVKDFTLSSWSPTHPWWTHTQTLSFQFWGILCAACGRMVVYPPISCLFPSPCDCVCVFVRICVFVCVFLYACACICVCMAWQCGPDQEALDHPVCVCVPITVPYKLSRPNTAVLHLHTSHSDILLQSTDVLFSAFPLDRPDKTEPPLGFANRDISTISSGQSS